MSSLITIQDFLIVPVILLVIYIVSSSVVKKNIDENSHYRYYKYGLWIKVFSGFVFAYIYLFYYGGGDTVYYYKGTQAIVRLFTKDTLSFFKILAGGHTPELFSVFDRTTGWPPYWRDINSFAVSRFNVPFYLLGFGSYLGNTLIMNFILFFGVWRFYNMVLELYPDNEKYTAWAIFFVPSVVFWSSGILKDGWTLTAMLLIFVSLHHIFIKKHKIFKNILILIFWSYLSFSIRPYIFYAAMASGMVWVGFSAIASIKSNFMRTIALPFIMLITWGAGSAIIIQTGAMAGSRYSSIDAMLETAWIIQDDLKKDYYGGNSFDIGYFEPTIPGVLKKAPVAIVAGMFRPFIWEGNGVLMILSGLEHLILMVLIFYLVLKTHLTGFVSAIVKDAFIVGITVFSVTFAFSVGLTTANFGALVRYAIPVKITAALVIALLYKKIIIQPK